MDKSWLILIKKKKLILKATYCLNKMNITFKELRNQNFNFYKIKFTKAV